MPLHSFHCVSSIEKSKLFCFLPCPSRESEHQMDFKPSENMNAMDASDTRHANSEDSAGPSVVSYRDQK